VAIRYNRVMKKHKQHHVWKSYLREWATKQQIFCLQGERIFMSRLEDAATQRQFYKLQSLTAVDIAYIRKVWIETSPPDMRPLHEELLTMFAAGPLLRGNLPDHLKANSNITDFLDEGIVNMEEDYHSRLEAGAQPIFAAIRRKDISFYSDVKLAGQFIHFLCVQYFRTTGMKARIVSSLKDNMNIDIGRCWNVMSHIMARNVGRSLFLERKRRPIILLENQTSMPFITSDQPAVNLLSEENQTKGPEYLSLYYPMSPTLGLLLDDPDAPTEYSQGALSFAQVEKLNKRIASGSYRHIFASRRDVLEEHCKPRLAEV
jgi:hypothetical protein